MTEVDDISSAQTAATSEQAEEPPSQEDVDLEDGELSDDGAVEQQADTNDGDDSSQVTDSVTIEPGTESVQSESTRTDPTDAGAEQLLMTEDSKQSNDDATKKRKHSTSSEENSKMSKTSKAEHGKDDSSDSSSSSEDEKSERKRKKKEEKRKKKEKKREKRKREKQKERDERKKRRRMYDEYDPYGDYYGGLSQRHSAYGDSRGGYYDASPPPGPYDSPPHDDSSDDEFSETLYKMVQSELMDPNVSMAEKEALFKKKRIPGLTQSKLNKILKKNKYQKEKDYQVSHHESSRSSRRGPSRRHRDEEPRQKCKFYAEGKCQKGDRCQYSHNFIPPKKMEACKFFLQGYCAKGDMCIYLHSEVPCKYFHTGQKCFNGDKCKFSHDPMTDSTRPLLEKAILLEETGTFRPDKSSLLGAPGLDPITRYENKYKQSLLAATTAASSVATVHSSSSNTSTVLTNTTPSNNNVTDSEDGKAIPSIFDLNLMPSADLKEKLDSGLYDELTAPLTDEDDDDFEFGSPVKAPKTFYSDTLSTPGRPAGSIYSESDNTGKKASPTHVKKKRWGPDLPGAGNSSSASGAHMGDGDSHSQDAVKKQPLLPLPTPALPPTPFSQTSSTNAAPTVPVTEVDKAQQAAANLTKILSALRSTANAVTTSTKASDPRVSMTNDPRVRSSTGMFDPRQQDSAITRTSTISDPRVTADHRAKVPLLPDPRSSPMDTASASPLAPLDPRQSSLRQINSPSSSPRHVPETVTSGLLPRLAPEINGKPQKPMEYKLKPCLIEYKRVYVPAGAETSAEMQKDPRIKRRLQTQKEEQSSAPPTLTDITADLHRMMSQTNAPAASTPVAAAAKVDHSRISARSTSTDTVVSDPRRSSTDQRATPADNRPTNPARATLSRIQATLSAQSKSNTVTTTTTSATTNGLYGNGKVTEDDEEENNSLTIDVPEDESRKSNVNNGEASYL